MLAGRLTRIKSGEMTMRINRIALAMTLCAAAFLAGRAHAGGVVSDLLEGDFEIDGSDDDDPGNNLCEVFAIGNEFETSGTISGSGTAGQAVSVDYITPTPTSASRSPNKVSVKQATFSRLTFHFGLATVGPTLVEKCSVSGAVSTKTDPTPDQGSVSVSCSGTDVFALLSADQAASLLTAFQDSKTIKVTINGSSNKGSLKVKCKGDAVEDL
jgi:hypothetical protein